MISHRPFTYVRHGQTNWNLTRKLQGNSDIPLNETGMAQARAARDALTGQTVAAIFCSPLWRARQTADIINETLGCPVTELDGLRECNFGCHEGVSRPEWIDGWLDGDSAGVPPEVEPFEAFMRRAATAINLALEHEGSVVIVAHAGTYIPINKSLPRHLQWSLPNGVPVLHTPPPGSGGSWSMTPFSTAAAMG